MSITSLLAAATITACGGVPAAGAIDGRMHIVATIGPTCPVERAGQPPCVAPYVGKLEILDSQGHHVAEVTTDATGAADVRLAPGVYTVASPTDRGVFPRLASPVTITVAASATSMVTVRLDTGIR